MTENDALSRAIRVLESHGFGVTDPIRSQFVSSDQLAEGTGGPRDYGMYLFEWDKTVSEVHFADMEVGATAIAILVNDSTGETRIVADI